MEVSVVYINAWQNYLHIARPVRTFSNRTKLNTLFYLVMLASKQTKNSAISTFPCFAKWHTVVCQHTLTFECDVCLMASLRNGKQKRNTTSNVCNIHTWPSVSSMETREGFLPYVLIAIPFEFITKKHGLKMFL